MGLPLSDCGASLSRRRPLVVRRRPAKSRTFTRTLGRPRLSGTHRGTRIEIMANAQSRLNSAAQTSNEQLAAVPVWGLVSAVHGADQLISGKPS